MTYLVVLVWVAVVGSTLALAVGLARSRRITGAVSPVGDLSEAAFLTGGPRLVVDCAIIALCYDGRMMIGGPGIVHVRPGARAEDPVQRVVLHAHAAGPHGSLDLLRLSAMADPVVQEIGDDLADRGLLARPGTGDVWKRRAKVQLVLSFLLLPVAFVMAIVQAASAGPSFESGLPTVLLVLPVAFFGLLAGGLLHATAGRTITSAGRRALNSYRITHMASREPVLQVALFGLLRLPDPVLRAQLARAQLARAARARRTHPEDHRPSTSDSAAFAVGAAEAAVVWCATSDSGSGGSCGSSAGTSCGGSGGSGCASSSGSSCGGGGSSCSSSSGSSCGSSSS